MYQKIYRLSIIWASATLSTALAMCPTIFRRRRATGGGKKLSSPSCASPKGRGSSRRNIIGGNRTVEYFRVSVVDTVTSDVRSFFDEACEFIEVARKANSNILVHCTMGMSRSSTIVIAYLMKFKGMRLSEAMAFTKDRRPVASPNTGFMSQLIEYEVELFGSPTIDLELYTQDRFGEVETFAIEYMDVDEEKKTGMSGGEGKK